MTRVPAEAFHPGEFIREEMAARGWTIEELSRRSGFEVRSLDPVLNGRRRVTRLLARQLGEVFEANEKLFLSLQSMWDAWSAKKESGR